MLSCKCSECSKHEEFNVRAAYEQLSRKYVELADIMIQYMSEANLKRAVRAEKAFTMAERLAAIIGGTTTSDFPECCSIEGADSCTGVLVHRRIVLTAAHCEGSASVRLNALTRSDPNGERISILRNRRHRDYNPTTHFFDFRVLILQRDAVTLPVELATTQEFRNAQRTTLVGYGRSEFGTGEKREVTVPIDHNPDTGEIQGEFDEEREFVAGGNGFDTCYGDSGGPSYITVGGRRKVAGLTSRGKNSNCGEGGIYTLIDSHVDFIREIAGQSGINFP
jgi:endonuclease G